MSLAICPPGLRRAAEVHQVRGRARLTVRAVPERSSARGVDRTRRPSTLDTVGLAPAAKSSRPPAVQFVVVEDVHRLAPSAPSAANVAARPPLNVVRRADAAEGDLAGRGGKSPARPSSAAGDLLRQPRPRRGGRDLHHAGLVEHRHRHLRGPRVVRPDGRRPPRGRRPRGGRWPPRPRRPTSLARRWRRRRPRTRRVSPATVPRTSSMASRMALTMASVCPFAEPVPRQAGDDLHDPSAAGPRRRRGRRRARRRGSGGGP